jgi:hypothetical protein
VPFNPFATDTIKICGQYEYKLNAATSGYYSYIWNRYYYDVNYRDSTLRVSSSTAGWQVVEAAGGKGCKATDSVYVKFTPYFAYRYYFNGDGLYSDASNWLVWEPPGYYHGKPPPIIGPNAVIYIQPSGICIMDVPQTIKGDCSQIIVGNNKKFIILGSLILQ